MEIDLTTLRMLGSSRTMYNRIRAAIPKEALDAITNAIISDVDAYYREVPTADKVDGAFTTFFMTRHPALTADQRDTYKVVIQRMREPEDPEVQATIHDRLMEMKLASDTMNALERYKDGGEIDIADTLAALTDKYKVDKMRTDHMMVPASSDPDVLLADDKDNRGLKWRLACLNMMCRPLRTGDAMLVAMRVGKGKTSFLASEATFMARQLKEYFGEDRTILYLNNEGNKNKVSLTFMRAALNMSVSELIAYSNEHGPKALQQKYYDALGGDIVRIFDIHGKSQAHCNNLIKEHRPGLIVCDMLANVKWTGDVAGTRADQRNEALAQWFREAMVINEAIGLYTWQLNTEAEGVAYPPQNMLKESGTGVQGATESMLFLGAINDPAFQNTRFLSFPKQKTAPDGYSGDFRSEVIFDGARARYRDPVIV